MPDTQKAPPKNTWQKTARRIRVPLGFLVAAVFLVFAQPTWRTLAFSLTLTVPGLWLRAYASGYIQKNAELTVTGPYAFTRNPLYLGSIALAFGFAAAAAVWWLVLLLTAMFAVIYIPTILSEESFLRATFPTFSAYAQKVPRLLPRLTPARFGAASGRFSRERYLRHREYNALVGASVIYALLIARMYVFRAH